ncbi:MAG: anti-sigma factor family protein [Chitinophagaceae bacterium]
MNTQHNLEERLWNYIDGTAPANEKTVIEKLLETDTAWKQKYHELLEVNNLLRSAELEAPSMRFSKNVMEEISKMHIAPATKTYINKKIIWGLGFFFIALFVGFLIYGFGQMNFSAEQETTLSKNLEKIDLSKFFGNTWVNVFMMINIVLGLFLLDNYLSNKRKEFRKA